MAHPSRADWFLVAVLFVAGAIWFALLFASQTHVHGDEALIGLMAKHISERRFFPFYMYGQPYNAGAAVEAYLAAIIFNIFGVGVVPLKSVIVALSLVWVGLFYVMAETMYDKTTARFATLVLVAVPTLLKWHFQVRGYSVYFLSVPGLTTLFWLNATRPRNSWRWFVFGLGSGLTLCALELGLTFVVALWILLLCWRRFSIRAALAAIGGFVAGYAPAIIYNFTHDFANWRAVFLEKSGGSPVPALLALGKPANLHHIFMVELPKFFGPDTVLWYYPEKSWTGLLCYVLTIAAVVFAILAFFKRPRRFLDLRSADGVRANDRAKDLLLLILTAVCFLPYLAAPVPTASYFFGGIFFLALLAGRAAARFISARSFALRICGVLLIGGYVIAGGAAAAQLSRTSMIETLAMCDDGRSYCMTRIDGRDIEDVESDLHARDTTGAWTTNWLTYPLLFELRETIPVSDHIFGFQGDALPAAVRLPLPPPDPRTSFVFERDFPLRDRVEAELRSRTGMAPKVQEQGRLVVVSATP